MKNKLEKNNVGLMVCLAIVTLGLYVPYWFLKKKDALNSLSSKKINHELAYFALAAYTIHIIFVLASFTMNPQSLIFLLFSSLDGFLMVIGGISIIILGFEIRKILIEHFSKNQETKISKIWTLFFTPYYQQHKINCFEK